MKKWAQTGKDLDDLVSKLGSGLWKSHHEDLTPLKPGQSGEKATPNAIAVHPEGADGTGEGSPQSLPSAATRGLPQRRWLVWTEAVVAVDEGRLSRQLFLHSGTKDEFQAQEEIKQIVEDAVTNPCHSQLTHSGRYKNQGF